MKIWDHDSFRGDDNLITLIGILNDGFSKMIPEESYNNVLEVVRENNFSKKRTETTYERMRETLRDSYGKRLTSRVREDGFRGWQNI